MGNSTQTISLAPITLEGQYARLEPLNRTHAQALAELGAVADHWHLYGNYPVRNLAEAEEFIAGAEQGMAAGRELPFAIIHKASGEVAGSTRYMSIRAADRVVEIGYTWLGSAYQRTAMNTECKLLLMTHAFETWGCVRVELKTDLRNERSQRAMERLGCVREGTLRKHAITWTGHVRDTVYYSVVDDEWPAVKARLQGFIRR
jgi:RimJ/RimL family protein N-acetyltransferase